MMHGFKHFSLLITSVWCAFVFSPCCFICRSSVQFKNTLYAKEKFIFAITYLWVKQIIRLIMINHKLIIKIIVN